MGGALKVLSLDEIVVINRRMIAATGGFYAGDDNMANPGSLDHVLDEIQGSVFGLDPYPTLIDKAAAVAWRIIRGHIFHDGNKRTGMEACRLILVLNGHRLLIDRDVIAVAIEVATGRMGFRDFAAWVNGRTSPL